ncbi:MAG: glycosyl transferase family 1 [Chitinophagaceae bacterium]|nr:glycosyl transferase family 1 [Chitinophagaceae bacterium]
MPVKTKLLFIYDYFYPAFKAGGPIQSLLNLSERLGQEYEIFILTGVNDLHEPNSLPGIRINAWQDLTLPSGNTIVHVNYAERKNLNKAFYRSLMAEVGPAVVYLNGIFSYRFFIVPLRALTKGDHKLVICPRGMLQSGALAGKVIKKNIYLRILKYSNRLKNVKWHATNEEEAEDIRREFGSMANIIVAGNIPKKPLEKICLPNKESNHLKLVYLSLISQKKNLLQLIDLVQQSGGLISLDIYGPLKDKEYGQRCLSRIDKGANRVFYKGDVLPEHVQATFEQYDASIL